MCAVAWMLPGLSPDAGPALVSAAWGGRLVQQVARPLVSFHAARLGQLAHDLQEETRWGHVYVQVWGHVQLHAAGSYHLAHALRG